MLSNNTIKRIRLIKEVLEYEHPQGAREIAYTLEAKGVIPHTKKEFNAIVYACRKGRWRKLIPLNWVADETRYDYVIPPEGYGGTEEFIEKTKYSIEVYERDFWSAQGNYFEIGLEKLGLAHFYEPTCKKYYTRLVPTKGDSSYSQENMVARRFRKRLDQGKKRYFLYLGDFNYKGYSIPNAFERNVLHFGGFKEGDIKFIRIALDFHHILKYPDLPFNPNPEGKTEKNPKGTKSHKTMKNNFLEVCRDQGIDEDKNIELEALKVHHPAEHLTEVEKAICKLLNLDAWANMKALSERDRETLRKKIRFT